ncbi:hypothetical protein ENUP19_0274G0020 [Entamoeba nuttalli]|uniref:RRM domain-containing protein n=1 Tax=Entamoeba nuttalli TaxID=412467 RepID=A0ABQ0DT46_9EUKA
MSCENTTVYITGFSNDIDEQNIIELFNERIKDNIEFTHIEQGKRKVLLISMVNPEIAQELVKEYNGIECFGRQLNISLDKDDVLTCHKLYVKGIDKLVEKEQFKSIMETYGTVISCNISLNKNKQSNGYGYVEFETEEECQKVLNSKGEIQKQIGDQNFVIEPFNKPASKYNCIYVTNIDSTVEDIDIIAYFSKFGEIEKKDKKIKCFFRFEPIHKKKNVFITYINEEDAIKAVNSPTENVLGKDIHIELYKSKKEKAQEKKENIASFIYCFTDQQSTENAICVAEENGWYVTRVVYKQQRRDNVETSKDFFKKVDSPPKDEDTSMDELYDNIYNYLVDSYNSTQINNIISSLKNHHSFSSIQRLFKEKISLFDRIIEQIVNHQML